MVRGTWGRVLAGAALGCVVAVAGCSGDPDDDAATAVATAGSTPTVDEPAEPAGSDGPTEPTGNGQPRPAPVEPVLPAAAEGTSVRSAKAFVRYYVDLLNYAMTTGDTDAFQAAATKDCTGCRTYVDHFAETYERGGFFRSRGWSLDRVLVGGMDESAVSFGIRATAAPVLFRESAGGDLKRSAPDPIRFGLFLVRSGEAWSVRSFSA